MQSFTVRACTGVRSIIYTPAVFKVYPVRPNHGAMEAGTRQLDRGKIVKNILRGGATELYPNIIRHAPRSNVEVWPIQCRPFVSTGFRPNALNASEKSGTLSRSTAELFVQIILS